MVIFILKYRQSFITRLKYNVDPWYFQKKAPREVKKKKKSFFDRVVGFFSGIEEKKDKSMKVLPGVKVRKQLDVAIHFYRRALLIERDNITAINGIGNAYYYQGQFVKAQKILSGCFKSKTKIY